MKKVSRLYDLFKPKHYILHIDPDTKGMTFTGSVVITGLKTGRPSSRLTFHQKDLNIISAHVVHHTKDGDVEVNIDRINTHKAYDEVRLHSSKQLFPGKYTISLTFSGLITKVMNGIYPCYFKHEDKEKMLIATQFESHHAREVFPSIDEPEAKATFDFSITTDKDLVVISNTTVKDTKLVNKDNNRQTTFFNTTPIMSTYLLAFIAGELEYLESKTKDGVVVRTYATPDNVKFTKFALETAVKCLEYYNSYFGIPYPLEKCDMIALPDFASGAMENWGCITYREHAVLVDPDNTSLSSKQYVAMVVAHELTHQWFGNLVTMKWWTDLWLNEGFATWFEYLAVDHIFPKWKMWTQFAVDEQQQALKLDALDHTHPIEVEVKHPDEIRTIFDVISYSKGASVINMLYHYLGEKDFQKGLQYYLQKHSYLNTTTSDLWDALEEVSSKPVSEFMHAWTSQSGYPILTAEIQDTKLSIKQKRFILNTKAKQDNHLWPVPLLANSSDIPELLKTETLELESKNIDRLTLNNGGSGFYRTVYNSSHLQALASQIKAGHLSTLDRLTILADITESSKAGMIDTIEVLNLLKAFRGETDNAVWDVIAGLLGSIRLVMNDESLRDDMKPYIRELVDSEVKRLGWDTLPNESHFDRLLRPTILGMASIGENKEVVEYSLNKFAEMHDPSDIKAQLKEPGQSTKLRNSSLDPDLRGVVYGTAARHGSDAEFNKLVAMHNNSSFSEERLNLTSAICGFKQPKLIKKALDLITTEHVRLQDVAYWLAYSFTNRYAHQITWEWMKEHWDWLDKNLGKDLAFYRMPIYSARGISDEKFLTEYSTFFKKVLSPAFERPYNQGYEMIEWQSAWRDRDLKTIKHYFKSI